MCVLGPMMVAGELVQSRGPLLWVLDLPRRHPLASDSQIDSGILSAVWMDDELLATALLFAGNGLLMFLSGGLVFLSYLRRTSSRNPSRRDPAANGGSYE